MLIDRVESIDLFITNIDGREWEEDSLRGDGDESAIKSAQFFANPSSVRTLIAKKA